MRVISLVASDVVLVRFRKGRKKKVGIGLDGRFSYVVDTRGGVMGGRARSRRVVMMGLIGGFGFISSGDVGCREAQV